MFEGSGFLRFRVWGCWDRGLRDCGVCDVYVRPAGNSGKAGTKMGTPSPKSSNQVTLGQLEVLKGGLRGGSPILMGFRC